MAGSLFKNYPYDMLCDCQQQTATKCHAVTVPQKLTVAAGHPKGVRGARHSLVHGRQPLQELPL